MDIINLLRDQPLYHTQVSDIIGYDSCAELSALLKQGRIENRWEINKTFRYQVKSK